MEVARQGAYQFSLAVLAKHGVVQRTCSVDVRRPDRLRRNTRFLRDAAAHRIEFRTRNANSCRSGGFTMSVVRAVLFDLDGTLVQTREASWRVFAKTNAALGLGINSQAEFFRLLEDNMFHGLQKHCGDDRKAGDAARHFLELLQREYNPEFVPGMADIVRAFAGSCS